VRRLGLALGVLVGVAVDDLGMRLHREEWKIQQVIATLLHWLQACWLIPIMAQSSAFPRTNVPLGLCRTGEHQCITLCATCGHASSGMGAHITVATALLLRL
jgi:hypothetical protein